ncbi:MAG: DUF1624 domain-containing protein [Flavobacteriaceae bacterium]|nr:DUF1624 domain-containing protein [Flavobacteriaceae bacterium]
MKVTKAQRLFFIDAMRAWAILMMLQGHFIDGLLDPAFRDTSNSGYNIWLYFRGITAPVFFTMSGFIFTYLLIRVPTKGWANPRIKKGIRRGLQLVFIGYLLRLNLFGLFKGEIYDSFFLVDVLHCIGISILTIIALYLLTNKAKAWLFPAALMTVTIVLFTFEPVYKEFTYPFLPDALANYFSKVNGSVFTIIPWVGYTAFGGFLSFFFFRYLSFKNLYRISIPVAAIAGLTLIFLSSPLFALLYEMTGFETFNGVANNNYLYIRLGDVLVVFAIFMIFRAFLTHRTIIAIGQNTLSIYVIHFIILYGSFTGLGLYYFFHHTVSPTIVIPAAILFMAVCSYAALKYDAKQFLLKEWLGKIGDLIWEALSSGYELISRLIKIGYRFLQRPKVRN